MLYIMLCSHCMHRNVSYWVGTVDWDETEEVGEVEEQVPSLHSDELLDDETEVNATTPEGEWCKIN